MAQPDPIKTQILIFGGGVAGLWIANELRAAGYSVLVLESNAMGTGQTIASQGILHGGTKYALSGFFDRSAYAIRDMPAVWRQCLVGDPPDRRPDLSQTRVRAEYCHLWRTDSKSSRFAQLGARLFLRTAPRRLGRDQWPSPLRSCRGSVYRLDEQVIDPESLIRSLAEPIADALMLYDPKTMDVLRDGDVVQSVTVQTPDAKRSLRINPQLIILAAGSGNAPLRELLGIGVDQMQSRPLHMVMLRGNAGELPELNGHCVDGRATRVTITTDHDSAGRTVWQVGGQIAERGVNMSALELIRFARDELAAVLPGIDLGRAEWATYTATRAEGKTALGRRPEGPVAVRNGNVVTCWPTKLVLTPGLASTVRTMLDPAPINSPEMTELLIDWPRPPVAAPPWETAQSWTRIP